MKAAYEVYRYHEKWLCRFFVDGRPNYDNHGTEGTGVKLYDTEKKAIAAGKRYLQKMRRYGYEV